MNISERIDDMDTDQFLAFREELAKTFGIEIKDNIVVKEHDVFGRLHRSEIIKVFKSVEKLL